MKKSGPRVGLDIEQLSIAGAQVGSGRQGIALTRANVQSLPPGLIFEGEVVDVDALGAELKSFWKQSGFSGKRFSLGIANQKVVVRTLEFPAMDENELRAAIEFQAQESIPIPLDNAILDFQVLEMWATEDGATNQRVLVVAAQRDMIQSYLDTAKKAGLTIADIDVQAFALMRSVAPPVSFAEQGDGQGEATAIVNISSGATNLVVAVNETPRFTRIVNMGCEALTESIIQNRGVSRDEADALRLAVGLSGSEPSYMNLDPGTVNEVHYAFDAAAEAFSDEIRRSIDYYHSQSYGSFVGQVLLTGEGALTRNITEYLARTLHLPVALGNTMMRIEENKSKIHDADLQAMSPRLAVAVGLALEGEV